MNKGPGDATTWGACTGHPNDPRNDNIHPSDFMDCWGQRNMNSDCSACLYRSECGEHTEFCRDCENPVDAPHSERDFCPACCPNADYYKVEYGKISNDTFCLECEYRKECMGE